MSTEKMKTHTEGETVVHITRPALTLEQRRDYCRYEAEEEQGVSVRLRRYAKKQVQCSGPRCWELVQRRIPILEWLPRYQFKENILGDVVAGITVAILHIPQGMGFALLANIPAISGIYMAFFPVIAYAILATSQHNSMGAFAVITMMTGKVVNQYATFPSTNKTLSDAVSNSSLALVADASVSSSGPIYTPIEVATIVCFMVGFWNVVMGFLTLGSLTVFFNDMLVSGFSTGAAVHVVTSQIKDLLGIQVQTFSGPFKLIYSYIDIFSKIATSNVSTVIISAISITVLSLNNEQVKPRLAKLSKIPVPIELLVVVVGTATSFLARLPATYDVAIVGEIPTGLPPPSIPPFSLAGAVAMDSLVIAVVAYAGSFSLAKIFALKHDYEVDADQELYAMGWGNIFSSFFSCGPMASAIARVLIQDSVGGVTQLACLITAFVILWVLLFIGPVFEFLPKACLASIIVVALKGMFMQVFDMVKMWQVSKVDAMLWIVTLLSVVIIDVDIGLVIGILVAITVLIVKGQNPVMARLGRVPDTDIYLETNLYNQVEEIPGVVVVSVRGPLHFANRDNFRSRLEAASGISPAAMKKLQAAWRKKHPEDEMKEKVKYGVVDESDKAVGAPEQVRYLILDCQGLCSCDASGAKYLARLDATYAAVGIQMCLAGLNEEVVRCLTIMGTLPAMTNQRVFHSVHDAVTLIYDSSYSTSDSLHTESTGF